MKKQTTKSDSSQHIRTLVLRQGRGERHYFADLWHYRDLFAILAWRDVVVQYKQTVIGVAWALVRPLITMAIFTVVFGRLARLPSDGDVPYPLMVMAGMLPWFLFSTILSQAANSLVANSNLVSKVYFPRLIVPVASAMVAVVDFAITLLLLLVMMLAYGVIPSWRLVFLPLLTAGAILTALGPSLLLAALNVRYRDFRFVLPFIVQFGLYLSPVGFSSGVVPERWRLIYALNPMVGIIDAFRWALFGDGTPLRLENVAAGALMTAVLLYIGLRFFRATERTFADTI